MAKETFLVMAMRSYKFQDKETNRDVAGSTVFYVDPDSATTNRDGEIGVLPIKCPAIPDVAAQIRVLPAMVELDFKQRPGSDGKPTLTLVAIGDQWPVNLHNIPALGKEQKAAA